MPRMKILNTVEQAAFDSAPVFNRVQRKRYFDFPSAIQRTAASLRTPTNQLCFLLSCGYFRATKRFFLARASHSPDMKYVAEHAGIAQEQIELDRYDKQTLLRHRAWILDFYGFRAFRPHGRPLLIEEINSLVRSQIKPKLIFWRCVDVLVRGKIEVPSYTRLTKIILDAINLWTQEPAAIIQRALPEDTRSLLDGLLAQEPVEGGTAPGKTSAYKLTLMEKALAVDPASKV